MRPKNNVSAWLALELALGLSFLVAFLLKAQLTPLVGWIFLCAFIVNSLYLSRLAIDHRSHFALILFIELTMSLLIVLSSPNIANLGSDELFEAGFADTIAKTGRIDPTVGAGFAKNYYGYTPVLHSLLATISILSGISTYALARSFIFILLRLVFISSVFLFVRKILNNDSSLSYLATLAFIPSARLMIMFTTRKLVGAIFLILAFYALYSFLRSKKNSDLIFLILFSVTLIFSDRSQSILFLFILTGYLMYLSIISFLNKELFANMLSIAFFTISYCILLIAWYLNSVPILITDINYIQLFMTYLGDLASKSSMFAGSSGFRMYSTFERMLAYGGQLLFILMAFIGTIIFLFMVSDKKSFISKIIESLKEKDLSLFNYLMIIGLTSYAFMIILVITPWFFMSGVYLWFICIPLSILAALVLDKVQKKAFLLASLMILLIFIGGLYAKYPPILLGSTQDSNILELAESRNILLLDSGRWLEKNSADGQIILGDRTIFDIYSGVYGLNVLGGENPYIPQLYSMTNETQIENQLMIDSYSYKHAQETIKGKIDYIVLNKDMLTYPSLALDGDTLTGEEKDTIDSVFYLDSIYEDSSTEIYFNHYSLR